VENEIGDVKAEGMFGGAASGAEAGTVVTYSNLNRTDESHSGYF
jgi:hypothetical protein